jgi:hypothetical protein
MRALPDSALRLLENKVAVLCAASFFGVLSRLYECRRKRAFIFCGLLRMPQDAMCCTRSPN